MHRLPWRLWVEMLCYSRTYSRTHPIQWPSVWGDNPETISFTISGLCQSNTPLWLMLTGSPGYPIDQLKFEHDVLDRTGPAYGSPLDIDWTGTWGDWRYNWSIDSVWTITNGT